MCQGSKRLRTSAESDTVTDSERSRITTECRGIGGHLATQKLDEFTSVKTQGQALKVSKRLFLLAYVTKAAKKTSKNKDCKASCLSAGL